MRDYIWIGKIYVENQPKKNETIFTISQKYVFKQAFEQSKKLQEEVILLFHIFSNRFENFVNSSNKEVVISYHQNKNTISP